MRARSPARYHRIAEKAAGGGGVNLLAMPERDPDLQEFERRMAGRYRWLFANWEETVRVEGERLDRLLRPRGVLRVLDVACGAGTQAIALAERGYEVVAADISPAMLAEARRHARERRLALRWCCADFRALPFGPGRFDAVLCCGSSLAHCLTEAQLARALGGMRAALRPGGILVTDLRNFAPIVRERPRFHFRQLHERPAGRLLVFDLWDYHADGSLTFHIFFVEERGGRWEVDCLSTLQAPHLPETFAAAIEANGFALERWTVTDQRVEAIAVAR